MLPLASIRTFFRYEAAYAEGMEKLHGAHHLRHPPRDLQHHMSPDTLSDFVMFNLPDHSII